MAFERLAYLEAVVGADITQFRKGMRDIRNEVGILSESMGGLAGLGRTLTYTVTAPAIAFGTMAVQQASEFDAAMRNINSIVGMSEDQLGALTAQVMDFGKTTRGGVTESANALYTVFSAGITDTAEAFNIMEASVRTAEAGLADLEVTTGAIVATQLAFNDTSAEMTDRVSNAMTRMVQVGVGSMDTFARAVAQVSPAASMLGMSVEELFGDLAFLTQRGQSAANAATNLNNALTSLAKPTEAMQAAFRELGVSGAEDLIEKFGGVNGAFRALIETTDGTQQQIQALFNNIRGARAINVFAQDIEGWMSTMDEFNSSLEGATMRAWEEQGKSFAANWDLMQSALGAAAITIGNVLIPVLIPLIQGITDLVIGFTELDPSVIQFGVAVTAAVAAAAPLMWLVGGLVTAINPLGIGIALLATAIATNWEIISDAFMSATADIVANLAPFMEWMDGFWGSIMPQEPVTMETPPVDLVGEPTLIDPMSIITVDTTKSLWQIFTEQGYDDYFSWQEFMRLAEEGGWTGGAIEVGTEITIDMSGVRPIPPPMPLVTLTGDTVETDTAAIEQTVTNDIAGVWDTIDWAALFDDLEFDYAASGFGDLVEGVGSFISDLAGADWTAIAALGAELLSLANILIGGTGTLLGNVIATIGSGLAALIDVTAALAAGDIEGALGSLANGFLAFGTGAFLTVVDVVATLVDALSSLFNLDIPSFSDFADGLREEMEQSLALVEEGFAEPITVTAPISLATAMSLETPMDTTVANLLGASTNLGELAMQQTDHWFAESTFDLVATVPADINWSPDTVAVVLDVAAMAQNMDLSDSERAAANAVLDAWSSAMSDEDRAAFQDVLGAWFAGGEPITLTTPDGWAVTIVDGVITTSIAPTVTTELASEPPPVEFDAGTAMAIANGWVVQLPDTPPTAVTTTSGEAPVVPIDTVDIATTFSDGFAEGMNADDIVTNYLTPIETKWNEMFSPDGMMTTNLTSFMTNFTAQAVELDTAAAAYELVFNDLATNASNAVNRMRDNVAAGMQAMNNSMYQAVQGTLKLQSVITNLLNMEGIVEVRVNIEGTGAGVQTGVDGSHAGGLANVPFDGYIAELHKDEAVLTAEENRRWQQMNAGVIMGTSAGSSVTNNNNQISIGANLTVDDMLFELERRGYRLEKR